MAYFPTFTATPAIDMMDMGINLEMYNKLQKVATENHCLLMIRKTSRGSVTPFQERRAVGKKLATKGKSSLAAFTDGNIAFFSQMAKSLDDSKWYSEQTTLNNISGEKTMGGDSKYKFIPKLMTQKQVIEILDKYDDGIETIELDSSVGTEKYAAILNGESIEINNNFGGKTRSATYKLKKVTWAKINQAFNNLLVAPTEGLTSTSELYTVYVKQTDTLRGFPMFYTLSGDILEGEEKFFPGIELEEYAPIDDTDASFRQVRILAILSEGRKDSTITTGRQGAGGKKYYEAVADYDQFMIVPDLGSGMFEISKTLNKAIYTRKGLSLLPIGGNKLYKSSHGPQNERRRAKNAAHNPYGLLSEYEMYIRREINIALGIKAAQHGIETANLFYTSDIKDPVIAIYPLTKKVTTITHTKEIAPQGPPGVIYATSPKGIKETISTEEPTATLTYEPETSNVKSGPCFVLSFKMLFELMLGLKVTVSSRRLIDNIGELNGTYSSPIFYEFFKNNFNQDFPLILNLSWGTEDYYTANKTTRSAAQAFEAKMLNVQTPIIKAINDVYTTALNGNLFETQPLSIRVLLAYLFDCQRKESYRTSLEFLYLFDKAVLNYLSTTKDENDSNWRELFYASGKNEDKINHIKEVYQTAVAVIERTLSTLN